MRRILTLLFTLTVFSIAASSQNSSKYNFSLVHKLKEQRLQNRDIALLVQGDVNEIKSKTEEIGGLFKYSIGNIASIKISISKINQIASLKSVTRIEDHG